MALSGEVKTPPGIFLKQLYLFFIPGGKEECKIPAKSSLLFPLHGEEIYFQYGAFLLQDQLQTFKSEIEELKVSVSQLFTLFVLDTQPHQTAACNFFGNLICFHKTM